MWAAYVLAFGAAAWGLSHLRAGLRERAAEAAFPPSGQFVEVGTTRVHYVTKGEGPDVVLIHGMSGNLRDMTFSLVDRLAQDFRVTAFDRPGMGYTDRLHDAGETIVEQAALLSAATRALGLEKPVLMGQSYGGSVALAWAVEFPETVSALVLTASPSHPWDGGMSRLYKVNSHPILGALAIPFEAAWVPSSYVQGVVETVFDPQDMPPGYDRHIGAPLTVRRTALKANALHRVGLLDQITELEPRYDKLDPLSNRSGADYTAAAKEAGGAAKFAYLSVDFANPTGATVSRAARERAAHHILDVLDERVGRERRENIGLQAGHQRQDTRMCRVTCFRQGDHTGPPVSVTDGAVNIALLQQPLDDTADRCPVIGDQPCERRLVDARPLFQRGDAGILHRCQVMAIGLQVILKYRDRNLVQPPDQMAGHGMDGQTHGTPVARPGL